MFDSPDFDVAPYGDIDMTTYVRRNYCSWTDANWRSLLVQSFAHARQVEHLLLPGTSDLHLVLCTAGQAVMQVGSGGPWAKRRWTAGRLELMVPGRSTVRSYAATSALSTIQVHIPQAVIKQTVTQLGAREPDFEAISAGLVTGDPVVEHLLRSLPAQREAGDVYAESAAAFLAVHLLSRGREPRVAGSEHAAVRKGAAIMQDRLAEPLTLADIAAEVHLSVYHFVRVFRNATGETPYRFLTRLRIELAQRLLSETTLTVEQIAKRCGFAGPGPLSTAFLRHVGVRPSVYRKI
ncbi:AraC family transcriptional regulator [Streptomyces gibsoniae]|uniref:AraC family transcriptional regulator n=1 Tax=Streptomyces gibsoniae TaxID=3075529 RepID=A0ABU2U0E2_9ACTN|nr:AraC family transcriptional regulator [Streptomyces sp. DSM 41699]MDT0466648.1 AraC family transcriptional regulator [Streptomyces sp. DSM 41699]